MGKSSSWFVCARVFTQSCGHLCGSVGLHLLQYFILSLLFWTSEFFFYSSLVPIFIRVILSTSTYSFILITSAITCFSTFKWIQMVSKFLEWLLIFFLLHFSCLSNLSFLFFLFFVSSWFFFSYYHIVYLLLFILSLLPCLILLLLEPCILNILLGTLVWAQMNSISFLNLKRVVTTIDTWMLTLW